MLELEGLFSFNLSMKSVRTAKVTEMSCFFICRDIRKKCVNVVSVVDPMRNVS